MLQELYKPLHLRTYSGQLINITDPDWLHIYAIDIAVHLSRAPRFGGATKKPYSVAEHSVWCADMAIAKYPDDIKLPLKCLLHDAHEFLLCDVPSPVKNLMEGYEMLAGLMQNAINKRFGCKVEYADKAKIFEIDKQALEWEYANKVTRWSGLALTAEAAQLLFIDKLKALCKVPVVIAP